MSETVRRRESMDEREPHASMGRAARATSDEARAGPVDETSGARARGLFGRRVVDPWEPNAAQNARWAGLREEPEGVVRPEDLPWHRDEE